MNQSSSSSRRLVKGVSQDQSSSFDIVAHQLEQQQIIDQQRLALNQAILGIPAAAVPFPQQGSLNQQISELLPSDTDLQRAYMLDFQRQQRSSQALIEDGLVSNSFQHNQGHMRATNERGGSDIDRLMAAERLVLQRRSNMEEAVRVMQLQGALQNAYYRQHRHHNNTGLAIPTGPIRPLQFLATNSADQQDPRLLTDIFRTGLFGVLPLTRPLVSQESPFLKESSSKRKAQESTDFLKEPAKKTALSSASSHFPLPSRSRARIMVIQLSSYRALWHDLDESEIQEEIFRRRIFEGIKILPVEASTRSATNLQR